MFNPIWLVIWTALAYLTTILANIKIFMDWKPIQFSTKDIYEKVSEVKLGPSCIIVIMLGVWRVAALYYAINALENGYGVSFLPSLVAAAAFIVIAMYVVMFAFVGVLGIFKSRGMTNDFIEKSYAWVNSMKDRKPPVWQQIIMRTLNTFIPLGYLAYLCYLQYA